MFNIFYRFFLYHYHAFRSLQLNVDFDTKNGHKNNIGYYFAISKSHFKNYIFYPDIAVL